MKPKGSKKPVMWKEVKEGSGDRLGDREVLTPAPERVCSEDALIKKKQDEIDKLTTRVRELEAGSSFFSTSYRMEQLIAFQLFESQDLSERELGQLVGAFNGRFHYGLFVQYFYENARH